MSTSKITTDLSLDDPIDLGAQYKFDLPDRRYLDNQARGCQKHLLDSLLDGIVAPWLRLDPSGPGGTKGDVVCLASSATGANVVKLATAANLANSKAAVGIQLVNGVAGQRVRVAVGGVIPPSVTGLAGGAPGYARINTTTGAVERVAGYTTGDYPIGAIDNAGNLTLLTGMQPIQAGGGAITGADVSLDDSAFAGNLVGVTDVQTFADTFDAFAGGGVATGTLNQILQYGAEDNEWRDSITLPSGGSRTISVATLDGNTGNSLTVTAGASSTHQGGGLALRCAAGATSNGWVSLQDAIDGEDCVLVVCEGTAADPAAVYIKSGTETGFKVAYVGGALKLAFFGETEVAQQTVSYGEWVDPNVLSLITAVANTGLVASQEVQLLNPPSDWAAISGFTATPASAATVTMGRDYTRFIRVGDAIRWQSSVPFVEKKTLAE